MLVGCVVIQYMQGCVCVCALVLCSNNCTEKLWYSFLPVCCCCLRFDVSLFKPWVKVIPGSVFSVFGVIFVLLFCLLGLVRLLLFLLPVLCSIIPFFPRIELYADTPIIPIFVLGNRPGLCCTHLRCVYANPIQD